MTAGPMSATVILAAVVGGGIIFIARRLFFRRSSAKLLRFPADTMKGKTIIVTGANSGIGKATATQLLKLQARVIMACRDERRAEEAAREIQQEAGPDRGQLVIKRLDLASLTSVRSFCEEIIKVYYSHDMPLKIINKNVIPYSALAANN